VLCRAVSEMAAGLIEVDLGGHVYKKRVALPGRGKRGGARTILGTNLNDRFFFLFGFEKNDRASIDARELAALQKLASSLLALGPDSLDRALAEEELQEICDEDKSTDQ
jgi:hypothetical protein